MVDINDDAQLDTSQIDDQRGRRGAAGGLAIGGGGVGIVIAIIVLLLGGNPLGDDASSVLDQLQNLQNTEVGGDIPSTLAQDCQTGADADKREDCRQVAFVNSIQKYWTGEYASRGGTYSPSKTTFFSGQVQTACGAALPSSETPMATLFKVSVELFAPKMSPPL